MEVQPSSEVITNFNGFVAKPENYHVLTRHLTEKPPDKMENDMTRVARQYLKCTQGIIRVLDGRESTRDFYDGKTEPVPKPDVVIYLDRSARPVKWFVGEFWSEMADKNVTKPIPKHININITDDMITNLGNSQGENFDWINYNYNLSENKTLAELILKLRGVFHRERLSESNWKNEVMDDEKSYLANKNILLVDEVKCEGRQMLIVQRLIKLAFPTSNVSGVYFWDPTFTVDVGNQTGQQMNVPAWYDNKNPFGRGIGEKNPKWYELVYAKHRDYRSILAGFFFSAPHFITETQKNGIEIIKGIREDPLADKLHQDIKQLHSDYMNHRGSVDECLRQWFE